MKRKSVVGLALMIAFLFVGSLPFPSGSDNEQKVSTEATGYVGQGWPMPASGWSHPGPNYPDWPANWRVLNVSTISDIDYNPGASMIVFRDFSGHLQSYIRGDKATHGFDWEMNSSITDIVIWSDMGHTWVLDYTMYEQFPVFEAPIDQDNLTTDTASYSKLFASNRTVTNYTILATNASWVGIRLYNSTTVELYGTPVLRDRTYTYYVNFSVEGSGWTWMNYTIEVDPNPPKLYQSATFYSESARDGSLVKGPSNTGFPPSGGTVNVQSDTSLTVGGRVQWQNVGGFWYPFYTAYRGFMSFDTSSIPDDAVITSATLKIRMDGIVQTDAPPVFFQPEFNVEIYRSNYGTLDVGDWASYSGLEGNIVNTGSWSSNGWSSMQVSSSFLNLTGRTQYALAGGATPQDFPGPPFSYGSANDYCIFYANGMAWTPELIINYTTRNTTYTTPQTFYQNTNYTYHLEANQTVDTWGVTSNATGVGISAYNLTVGAVSWHPTNWNAGRYYWINATFANPNGTSYYNYSVSVLNIKPVITSLPSARATAGSAYVYNPTADEDAYGGVWTTARSNYPNPYAFTGGKLKVDDISAGSWWFNLTFDDMSRTSNATATQNFTMSSVIPPYTGILEANFKYNLTGMTVKFTDLSKGPVAKWFWQFGDNTTSTLKDPTHAYLKAGKYKVKLTIMDSTGRSETTEKLVVVQGRGTGMLGPYSFVAPMSLIVVCVAVTMTLKNRFVALGAMVAVLGVIWFWVTGQFPTISVSL